MDECLFPERELRIKRIEEINSLITPLIESRNLIQKEINKYLLEVDVLNRLNQLQDYEEGKIDLKVEQK